MPTKVEEVEGKVSELERIVKDIAYAQLKTERSISELTKDVHTFQNEMRDFKDEMKDFKTEMLAFKDETREDRKRMNKQWGDLANRLGTLAEDVVAPNIPRIVKEYFNCDTILDFAVRRRVVNSKEPKKAREFDAFTVCNDFLLVNETKSTPKIEYIDAFIESLKEVYDYFPDYRDKKIIPVFSSFYLPEDVVTYLTKNKIYALGMKDDTMEILNPELKRSN
ncbi:MAG: hypothetical protein DRP57_05180 [Spirochaetes bacterium]|nr:MAG: hypothetical protein DRP57_05180 [Spirochaetota bacterium]